MTGEIPHQPGMVENNMDFLKYLQARLNDEANKDQPAIAISRREYYTLKEIFPNLNEDLEHMQR